MYTLEALLRDVQQKHGRLQAKGGDGGAPTDYAEVWNTFLRYARSCLDQKRGLNLATLGKLGWQASRGLHNVTFKPCFTISDQFCRAYCSSEAQRKLAAPTGAAEDCPIEEFNFSKAAIKFSQQLTKDQVFTGLKSIVQLLGEAVASGQEVDVAFGDIGRFCSKEKEPRFHFASEFYQNEGLEAPAGSTMAGNPPPSAASFSKTAPRAAQGLGVRGAASTPALSRRLPTPAPSDFGGGYSEAPQDSGAPRGMPPPTPAQASSLGAPPSIPAVASTVSNPHALTATQYKKEVAFKEAMDRHIGEMEARASEAMLEKQAYRRHVDECLTQERDDIMGKRYRLLENQHFVTQQKLLNEERRKEQRQEDIIAASAHDFPRFTEPAEQEMKEFILGQQARVRKELDEQVRTNTTLKNLSKQRDRQLELSQLQANRHEMSMLREADRAKKAYDKEALATAWNSDIRMKNVWKAIENHSKMPEAVPNVLELPPSRGGSVRSAGRIMTGSSRKVPLGASRSLAQFT